MNTPQIEDKKLKRQLMELLEQRFNGDTDCDKHHPATRANL